MTGVSGQGSAKAMSTEERSSADEHY